MSKADKMINAWQQCKVFNEVCPIGSTVKYKEKEYIVKEEAYVLVDVPHVLLSNVEHSVPLSEIGVPVENETQVT
jgi:hypothetical protein